MMGGMLVGHDGGMMGSCRGVMIRGMLGVVVGVPIHGQFGGHVRGHDDSMILVLQTDLDI